MRGVLSTMAVSLPEASASRVAGSMLDPRLYRGALLPILVAVIAFAFSLKDRPAPAGAASAPAAFVGERAALDLRALAARYPHRRPRSAGDEALAAAVQRRLAAAGATWRVTRVRAPGETIARARLLTTILARQAGAPGPQLVVVSHRDAAGRGAAAELSGTAAMLELARDLAGGRTRRTIVLASTSGGSGGGAPGGGGPRPHPGPPPPPPPARAPGPPAAKPPP